MRRREFLGLIGGAAAAWTNVVRAEQAPIVIGYLSARSPDESKHLLAAFREGLKSEGFVEGQNVELRFRWAEGHYDRLPGMATELVQDPTDSDIKPFQAPVRLDTLMHSQPTVDL